MQKLLRAPKMGACDKGVKMNRIVTTFKTVKPDSYNTFVKMYEENENIMPC